MSASDEGHDQLLDEILARAGRDPAFRRRLLTEPAQAIYDEFGIRIPAGYHIKFIEREPGVDALIVLPAAEEGELTEEDLEQVAGGMETSGFWAALEDERSSEED